RTRTGISDVRWCGEPQFVLLNQQLSIRSTRVNVISDYPMLYVAQRREAMNKVRVIRFARRAGFNINAHRTRHSILIRHLQDQETSGPEGSATARDYILEIRERLGIVDSPREGADDVVRSVLVDFLHRLDPHAVKPMQEIDEDGAYDIVCYLS